MGRAVNHGGKNRKKFVRKTLNSTSWPESSVMRFNANEAVWSNASVAPAHTTGLPRAMSTRAECSAYIPDFNIISHAKGPPSAATAWLILSSLNPPRYAPIENIPSSIRMLVMMTAPCKKEEEGKRYAAKVLMCCSGKIYFQ